MEVNTLAVH